MPGKAVQKTMKFVHFYDNCLMSLRFTLFPSDFHTYFAILLFTRERVQIVQMMHTHIHTDSSQQRAHFAKNNNGNGKSRFSGYFVSLSLSLPRFSSKSCRRFLFHSFFCTKFAVVDAVVGQNVFGYAFLWHKIHKLNTFYQTTFVLRMMMWIQLDFMFQHKESRQHLAVARITTTASFHGRGTGKCEPMTKKCE